MFNKLFGRKEAPTKDGKTSTSLKVDGARWVKKFSLQLDNMEGTPSYALVNQLTVGSEIGNIVIADPSLSPRHATFVLQEDVVSVLDHGSLSGTTVNGQKIPPGRYIILEEDDKVLVGELQIKIMTKAQAIEQGISDEELLDDEEAEELFVKEEEDEGNDDYLKHLSPADKTQSKIKITPKEVKPSFFKKLFQKKPKAKPETKKPINKTQKKKNTKSFSDDSTYATNSLIRVLAVLCDFLLAYSVFIMLSPFDEFRTGLHDAPTIINDLLGVDWNSLWITFNQDYAVVGEMLKDAYIFLSSHFHFLPLILLFILVRFLTTLFLGVSLSELALGVTSHGNGIWKRIGGGLRVLLGVVTGPFLLFDLPSLFSKRTVKEFLTFTRTSIRSKLLTIMGTLLYLPLLVCVALLAPLVQGFELFSPLYVSEKTDQRVKKTQEKEAPQEVTKIHEASHYLNLGLSYDSQKLSLFPMFKFSGQKNKLNYIPYLVFYQRELQRSVQLELLKRFSLKELLAIGIKENFFLYEKFPEIYNFVYQPESPNSVFKTQNDEKSNQKFAQEILSFTKICLELDIHNAPDFMQEYTPFLKGLVDYRSSLLALIEYKEFDQISFFKIGKTNFLKISYGRQKPFDLLIPLTKGEGHLYKVEFDKKENLNLLANEFYQNSLKDTNWVSPKLDESYESLTHMQVLDTFGNIDLKKNGIEPKKAQALYGHYYEKSAELLKGHDVLESELWKKSIDSIFGILGKIKESTPSPAAGEENVASKLYQNFQDLKNAFDNKNKEYFGVENSVSI